jgi:hypothetical protein
MAEEKNGNHDGGSRLDRIEAALELFVRDHEDFRQEHKLLLRAQVLQQERLDKLDVKIGEIGDKVDGLIGFFEASTRQQAEWNRQQAEMNKRMEKFSQDTDRRLRRLEGEPPAA